MAKSQSVPRAETREPAVERDREARPGNREPTRIRIGISACLLGQKVRYDGGHKRDAFLVDTFGRWVEWVPVCPEVEAGLGTPREPIHLRKDGAEIRVVGIKSGSDYTGLLRAFSRRRVAELAREDLSGYILKNNSPSCGMERLKVYEGHGAPARSGRGVFAQALLDAFPDLPVEEEGRLSDARLRENFVERVFAYRRLRDLFAARWTAGSLVRFHTAHKLVLLAHSPDAYRRLGRLVAGAARLTPRDVREQYRSGFMRALAVVATRGRHANVLQHMLGYFKIALDAESRAELADAIRDYRAGLLPLIVPITLFRHHVRRCGVAYLAGQAYLDPYPGELMLRNHV